MKLIAFVLGTVTTVGKYPNRVLTARMNVDTKEVECKYDRNSKLWHKIPTGTPFEATFKDDWSKLLEDRRGAHGAG